MGNSSSSNKTPEPVVVKEQKKEEQAPVVIDTTPKVVVDEPVVVESPVAVVPEATPAVIVAEEPTVEAITEALEKVAIVQEEPAVAVVEEKVEEKIAEPTEFSLAGKALKLDTAEDVAEIVKEISALKNLQKVSFVGNTLGIEASKALAEALDKQESLRDVDLSDCFTGRMKEEVPVSVAAFGAVLVTKKNLERVNFSDNAFGPIGAKAMVELLSGSASLQDLILNNNGLGPEGGRIIAEALIESAQVRSSAEHGKPLRKVLIGRNRLENGSSASFAKMLEAHSSIQEFALPQCGIRSEGIVILSNGLAKCSNLKTVDLQDNTFTTVGAKAFAEAIPSWKNLVNLNIGDCMCEEEGSVLVMKALCNAELVSTLVSFNFQYNEMKENGAQILAQSLDKFTVLKTLMLNGNAFDPEGEAAVAIKDKVDAEILDDWSDMEYEEDEDDVSDAGSGFITEKERQELIVEAESEDEKETE